jgi:hypothetical protein
MNFIDKLKVVCKKWKKFLKSVILFVTTVMEQDGEIM